MQTTIKNMFLLSSLITGFSLILAVRAGAQTFTTLYGFTNGSDGSYPESTLVLSGTTLFGTAYGGGIYGYGTVFAVNTDGADFTTLNAFFPDYVYPSEGVRPKCGLILSGNTLYGTTSDYGEGYNGTVFAVNTAAYGFTLQSTTKLSPAAWSTVSPAPVVINGQNTVTNPISGTQQFYRLSQ